MKVKIRDLLQEEDGSSLEGSLSTAHYDLPLGEYQNWKKIEYSFLFQIIGTECLVQGNLESHFEAQCGRCLEPLPCKVEVPYFQHSYPFKTNGDVIDLTNEIREDILLHLPLVAKCQLDPQGKCPYTGKLFQEKKGEFSEIERDSIWPRLEDL